MAFQTGNQSRLGWRAWLALPILALALVFLFSNTTIMRQFTSERRVVSPGAKANVHKVSLLKDLTQRAGGGGGLGESSEPAPATTEVGVATPEEEEDAEDATATATAAAGLRSKPAAPRRRTRSTKASSAKDGAGGAEGRCQGALLGDWCGPYLTQDPVPAVPPPAFNNTCLWGCNFVGVCDAQAGWCRCPAGWTGDDCSTVQKRHCSQRNREHGFEQWDKPPNYAAGGLILRCAGTCDTDIGMCFCPEEDEYGRLPADPKLPPGTPPRRFGRPMTDHCQPSKDPAGNPAQFGTMDPESLFGASGWCKAAAPQATCTCMLDGVGGPTCDVRHESFCPNQCNGHGDCNLGFCQCHEGWWGQDCANRRAGVPLTPGLEDGAAPWLKPHVHTPAAAEPAPGATRRRPLIYVYELPPMYNQLMLQYRLDRKMCTHRLFTPENGTVMNDENLYNTETGLHEMMLQSEHRTLDPEEADFFYLPIYTSCMIFPILNAGDWPWFHSGPVAYRTHAASNMMIEVFHWIRSHHPYWDRHGGEDHIVFSVHDEGSCWVPAVLRPAIILSHFGRTELDHVSTTGYWPDNYSIPTYHAVWQPEGFPGDKLGRFACFDPEKDLVVPPMFSPNKYHSAPLFGAPTQERTTLAFFKGRLLMHNPPYSRGIRQNLTVYARDHDWWGEHKIYIGDGMPPGEARSYSDHMASSKFCLAIMGDGWSSRFEDSMVHGCIPVIIQDGIEVAFSSIIDVTQFSIRVEQKDMFKIPEILKAIPEGRVLEMQAALARVWRRYVWSGFRPYGEIVRDNLRGREEATKAAPVLSQPPPALGYAPEEDDALSTLMQWLYTQIPLESRRRRRRLRR